MDSHNKYIRHQTLEGLKNTLEISTLNKHNHQDLVEFYEKQKEYNLAIEQCIMILETNPLSEYAFRKLGELYQRQKKYDLAMEAIIKFTDLNKENDFQQNKRLKEFLNFNSNNYTQNKDLSIKIIKTPAFIRKSHDELDYFLLLPLGMAQIVSYLRANGINIIQDDLNIKVNYDNRFGEEFRKIDKEVFFDEKRIIEYSRGEKDIYIDSIMRKVEEKTELEGYEPILLSAPENFENSSAIMFILAFTRYIKDRYNPTIVLGGFGPSVDAIRNYNSPDIDFIVKSWGEKVLFKLLNGFKNKVEIKDVPELIVSDDGKTILSDKAVGPLKPDFDGLPIKLYRYKNLRQTDSFNKETRKILEEFNNSKILIATFKLIEGCPYECIFCDSSIEKVTRALSPERAVAYLKDLKDKHNITGFFFLSDTLNVSKRYISNLCDEMIKSKLDVLWSDCARADNLDKGTLLKLRMAGCIRLIFGLETASPKLLSYVNKQLSLKRLEDIIRWSDEAGIWVGLEIICGFPYETKDDLEMTVDFLRRNRRYINTVYYNQFDLREHSKMYLNPKEYGIGDIFEVNWYQDSRIELRNYVKYGYNEIDGLKWEDKCRQIVDSYNYVLKKSGNVPLFPFCEMEHFLFFLYSKYKQKRDIVEIYNKVVKCLR